MVKFLPRRLSFSKICDILVAYLNAGADKEYVGVTDVTSKSNVTLHNISRNNNFFKSWSFTEESEKDPGKYKLSREAAEFASTYRIDPNGELTRQMLRDILTKDEVITKFAERIKRENLDRDATLIELPRVIGDLRADKVGLNAFLDMIAYTFGIEEISAPTKPARPARETKISKKSQRAFQKPELPMSRAGISINLTISPEISPERLKEYIKAMLEAYDEYSQDK